MPRTTPKGATPKKATQRAARTPSRGGRRASRVRASAPAIPAGATPAAVTDAVSTGSVSGLLRQDAPLTRAMARTVADAQRVGRELGSAGASIARGALGLAYNVGAVLGLAAQGLVSATLDVADTVSPRPPAAVAGASLAGLALRKPPLAVAASGRAGRSARRRAG